VGGGQPHYVVAIDYGDAEKTIKEAYGWNCEISELVSLGSYIQISDAAARGGDDGE
jgi:hypothetical protein